MRIDATSAIELSTRRHLDSFVIDCDDVPQATDLLSQIRNTRSNKLSVIFAVVNATTSVGTGVEAEANFVLGKPVQDKQLRSFLDIAIPKLSEVHAIEGGGLGMLIFLQRWARDHHIRFKLFHPNPCVKGWNWSARSQNYSHARRNDGAPG